jgi:site-specific recombinase XerD
MTNQFYSHPRALQRFHEGPWGSCIETYAEYLHKQGYSRFTARYYIRLIAKLSKWLGQQKLDPCELNEQKIDAFILRLKRVKDFRVGDVGIMRAFLRLLHNMGVVCIQAPKIVTGPLDHINDEFRKYLEQERGLAQTTMERYLPFARQFLIDCFSHDPIKFSRLCAKDITGFILRHAHDHSPGTAKLMVTSLRSFLRFLKIRGEISTELATCVPTVANWRLATLPKSIEPEQVEKVLATCNRQTAVGQRNYAILLLLARLGLRAGEVRALTLEDINWKAGELTIRGKGPCRNRLPLLSDVGKALVIYLKTGRPQCSSRHLFIRFKAPLGRLTTSDAISSIVRRSITRAGISSPHKGAHVLRHSLATRMLKNGASLCEIGEILRHQNPETTAIYAKVDLVALRQIAQPWPGGES